MNEKTKFWQFRNEADSDGAELLLYNEIASQTWYGDEVTPKQFADDLKAVGGKPLTLRINSPGGDVFAAQAIYNQLKAYSGNITAYIDGMAASAATIITCAADRVVMPDNAIFMIHNPLVGCLGYLNEQDLESMAKQLKQVKQTIVNAYLKKCSIGESKLNKLMDNETWMTAEEALSYGFVDSITDDEGITNSIKDGMLFVNSVSCRLDRFQHPERLKDIVERKKPTKEEMPMNEKSIMDKLNEIVDRLTPGKSEDKEEIIAAERKRMLDLDSLRDGNPVVDRIVDIAKGKGNTAEEIAAYVDAVKEQKPAKDEGLEEIKAIVEDQVNSGGNKVQSNTADKAAETADSQATDIANLVATMKNLRGE